MYFPLISSTFPEPRPGPYATGYVVARLPAETPYVAPVPHLVKDDSPALRLSENVMAIYYPTPPVQSGWFSGPSEQWIPGPLRSAFEGYAKYAPIIFGPWCGWLVGGLLGRVRMPVHVAAPLAQAEAKFPLVIFSHGLVGTRNTYSQFCSSLASEGYVVVAVEHADGSGPCAVRDGKPFVFTKLAETYWDVKDDGELPGASKLPEMMSWRAHQLDFRVREVYSAYGAFKQFLAGSTGESDAGAVDVAAALKDKVDVTDLQLIGHSFGGATALRLLTTAPPPTLAPLPVIRTIMLDPWMEPFAKALPVSSSKTAPHPTLVINSQSWTDGDFFNAEIDAVRPLGATLCTIVGLGHQGFSDWGFVTFRIKAREYLRSIHSLTMSHLRDTPSPLVVHEPDNGKPRRGEDGKLAGEIGQVVLHLAS